MFDSLLHAWRLRLPFILIFLLGFVILTLPNWVMHDGSPEGKIRIIMMYSGHLQIYALSFAALIYSIWFEKFEKENRVHLLMATYPVTHRIKLLARLSAYFVILWGSSLLFQSGIGYITYNAFNQFDISAEEKEALKNKLLLVREYSPLELIRDHEFEQQRIEKQFQQAFPIEHGLATGFEFPVTPQKEPIYVRGKLMSLQDMPQAELVMEVRSEGRLVWSDQLMIEPNVEFYHMLPYQLSELNNLRLNIIQGNPDKKPLYYVQTEPISLSNPKGSFQGNLIRGTLLSSILILTMSAIGVFFSQVLSFQGSIFTSMVIYIFGSSKAYIYELLFKSSTPNIPGMTQDTSMDPVQIFYSILWKPILFLLPDFQALNPTNKLMNGEYIPWNSFVHVGSSIMPFLFIILVYTLYFLPKQEVDKRT